MVRFLWGILLVCVACTGAMADTLLLRLPTRADGSHAYYHELVRRSLEQLGHTVIIEPLDIPSPNLVGRLLDSGDLTLNWMEPTPERDRRWLPLEIGLSGRLEGARIIQVRPGLEQAFADTANTDQVHGVLWRLKEGEDYFLSTLSHYFQHHREDKNLRVEPHLLLLPRKDVIFYLSPVEADLMPVLRKALIRARDDGLMDRLIRMYWAGAYRLLHIDRRLPLVMEGN